MITTQVVAHVRRVLRGHSDRALIHAVDGGGLEYKLEVPLDQVRALDEREGHVLTITYALHTVPGLAPPSAELPAPSQSTDASPAPVASEEAGADAASADAEFMALMSRRQTASPPAGEEATPEPAASGARAQGAEPSIDAIVAEVFGL